MQTKRDQVQAHLFVVGRLVSALVRSEPDAPQTPMRRSVTGMFAGCMIAVLVLAGFAVYGLVRPGGSRAFAEPGTIIVEKETGSRFLLVDGLLRPVLNITSARLAAGSNSRVRNVSRRSLAGLAHGGPIGIPGAPDSLPDAARLSYGPWLICSPTGRDTTGAGRSLLTVAVGAAEPATTLPADRGALVRAPDGTDYLAWQAHRLRIASRTALLALGYGNAQPVPVAESWVNALPAGPDLAARAVAGRGQPGPGVGGRPTITGQVLLVRGGGAAADAFYLVAPDGLAALSQTEAALLLGDPASAAAYPGTMVIPIELSAAAVAAAPVSARVPAAPDGLPPAPPRLVEQSGRQVPCVRAVFRSGIPELQVAFVEAGAPVDGLPPGRGLAGGAADQVTVPPGGGLVVRDVPAPGVDGALYLLTDLGVKYPLPSDEVLRDLGYEAASPVPVPGPMLAFIPTGPVLDPEAARTSQPAVSIGQPGS